jgi:hypothetical protein
VTRDELARASAVAARVAASEQKAGLKVEGTIPMSQHGERAAGGADARARRRPPGRRPAPRALRLRGWLWPDADGRRRQR